MKSNKKIDKKNNLEKNSFIVLILTTLGSAINYLCQIFMGNVLTVKNYGTINTIFSLVLIFSIVGNTGFMFLSKELSKSKSEKKYKSILKYVNVTTIILFVLSFICIIPLKGMLESSYLCTIVAISCFITGIYPIIYQGVFGGLNKFLQLGLYTLIIPFLKLFSLIPFFFFKINGDNQLFVILSFLLIGNLLSILIGKIYSKKHIVFEKKKDTYLDLKEYLSVLLLNFLMIVFMNVDILYLSIFTNSKEVGLYSSVLIFGKMVYFLVTALVTVMLPLISKEQKNEEYTSNMLKRTLLYTIVLSLLFIIPLNCFNSKVLSLLFGNKFNNAIPYLIYASFIPLAYSLNVILMNYLVGIEKTKFIKLLFIIGMVIMIIGLLLLHSNKYASLLYILIIHTILFIVNYISIVRGRLKNGAKN